MVFSQTDGLNLPDLLVVQHSAITQGVSLESDDSMDPRLPQDNGTSKVPEMKKGLWAIQALK